MRVSACRAVQSSRTAAARPSHSFPIVDHPLAKNFVDFDEDLQVKDLENAAQEGFDSSELLKRYSTVGMGPSQGKHSNMNALRILARVRGMSVEQLGLTTSRPMYHPVPLKLLAGRSFNIERRTPIDAQHRALGAVWMPAGKLAPARILRRERREPGAKHRCRSASRALEGRIDRRRHARKDRDLRPAGRDVSGSSVRRQIFRHESRHDALWP